MEKTTNYQLHLWGAEDRVCRSQFNADNQALEAALSAKADQSALAAMLVTGTRTGTGSKTTIQINLGFRPRAVLYMNDRGQVHDYTNSYGGLALDGSPLMSTSDQACISITDTGFSVTERDSTSMNSQYYTYYYLALR